jgi:hypothetical protein
MQLQVNEKIAQEAIDGDIRLVNELSEAILEAWKENNISSALKSLDALHSQASLVRQNLLIYGQSTGKIKPEGPTVREFDARGQ